MNKILTTIILGTLLLCAACQPKMNLFPDSTDPLKETVLQGESDQKILVIPIQGIISDQPKKGLLSSMPSMVQEVSSKLALASKDPEIKAVILKINSPGGTVTASDIIYREISEYKKKTGVKVIAAMMDIAASGGYYISLSADRIIAHPTTMTGSVGVIFMRPKLDGLMDKIGVSMDVTASGRNKDMASPFRKDTPEEEKIISNMVADYAARFIKLVKENRTLSPEQLEEIKTARVFSAQGALKTGLVDKLGYLDDAVADAKKMAGLPDDAQVITYKRKAYPNDTLYNSVEAQSLKMPALVNFDAEAFIPPKTGFYYMWYPATR
ncbi:signal peptide peptidase SppA [Maridesulfovibrio bastinii]|uniref:signal peptide peptidase SppA n=1 Tax=Maridesulfovibrio bastinii TaxID=47157 RepID=UPI000425B369|nr:signal peptide peptidase SppA [Maridesulfovibrio bastinii]